MLYMYSIWLFSLCFGVLAQCCRHVSYIADMKAVYSALVFCLFLSMVAVGLQIAASITQGWKIIEGEHLVQKAPWVSPSQFGMNENDTKHVCLQFIYFHL